MYKKIKACGQNGIFIPIETFEKGLFLEEPQKKALQEKILANDTLIQELKKELGIHGDDTHV